MTQLAVNNASTIATATGNITHLIATLGRGGAEKQLFSLASALQDRGWRQSIIVFSPGGYWIDRFKKRDIPVFVVPRSKLIPWRLWKLRRILRQRKTQIALSWSEVCAIYTDWAFGVPGMKRIINVRGDMTINSSTGEPRGGFASLFRALRRADYVLSNSKKALDALAEHNMHLPSAEVITNMLSMPPGESTRPAGPPRIVGVGSLKPRKAYHLLLRAAGALHAEGRPFELVIAGDGPDRAQLEALAAELGLVNAHKIQFLGERDDIPALLKTAHILAHPATSEGLSNTILEAMAEGLAVVACPVGATPELIQNGREGILAPVGDLGALTDALRRLFDSPSLRDQLGRAARTRVQSMCDESTLVSRYESIFRNVLAIGRP